MRVNSDRVAAVASLADDLGVGVARDVEQELKDYHREFDFVRDYFPETDIRTVDGTKKVDAVAKEIAKLLQGAAR